ncbi:MAG: outer membrane protein assembly factor BamA [Candidatus Marinimicrobia bacterium]|nr:outer membrane protein assembly factor BamA [Candidatus Neomarinimicrobiota bacterium]
MKAKSVILVLLVFVLYSSLLSQGEIKILGVTVQGNKFISDATVKIQSGLYEGKEITLEDIQHAINQLWKLKLFSDIKILLDKSTSEGVFLIIKVREYPRLEDVIIKGNKKIRERKIKEEIKLVKGQVLTSNLIFEARKKILSLYRKEGYLLATVTTDTVKGEKENSVDLVIGIHEGKKVRIKDIIFKGNRAFSDSRLRRQMKETHKRNVFLLRLGEFDREKYEEDKKNVIKFYRNHGYKDARITYDTIRYSDNKKWMFIEIGIYEGPRYRYRNIEFVGNRLYSDRELLKILGIKSGAWYSEEEFEKAVFERVDALYKDQGYLFSQVEPHLIPVTENELDVRIYVTENKKVRVNRIDIVGNDKTHENVIRRELFLYPGDIFRRDALIRSQRNIFMLNYFSNVEPNVIPVSEDKVDLEIKVEEKSSDRANLSFSYSELYGLIGGGGVEFTNFRGRGQSLTFSYQQGTGYSFYTANSPAYKSFSIGFTEPYVFDTPNLFGFSLYYYQRGGGLYYYPFDLDQAGFSIRWGRRFRWPDRYFRGTWVFSASRKKYKNINESYLQEVLNGEPNPRGVSITQIIRRDSRDRPEFTTTGSVMEWLSCLSGGFLGGNEDFYKNQFTLEFYTPTFWKFVIFNHLEFGIIKRLYKDSFIPPDERYIMGGAGMIYGISLRGYDDYSVGPRQSKYSTNPYGGETYFKYTFEYRVLLSENPTIYLLTFFDAGNTWKNLSVTDPFDLKRSAGFGVRFFMPALGMIGFDFGYGFDDVDLPGTTGYGKPEGWKTHFIFGMPF